MSGGPRWSCGTRKLSKTTKNCWRTSFTVGFLGYYRGYVKIFSIILKPLHDLLKVENNSLEIKAPDWKSKQQKHSLLDSRVHIKFTNDHQNKIIDILKSPQVMSFPDFEKPFISHCDASELGLGAVLCQ